MGSLIFQLPLSNHNELSHKELFEGEIVIPEQTLQTKSSSNHTPYGFSKKHGNQGSSSGSVLEKDKIQAPVPVLETRPSTSSG